MLQTLSDKIAKDPDYPERRYTIDLYQRVLKGKLYDVLDYPFWMERLENAEYIPLKDRRPSVRYNLCRKVAADSVGLLFSAGHFPTINVVKDPETIRIMADLVKETRLNEIMLDAGLKGSVGSVAILFQVIKGRIFFRVMETHFLTPVWSKDAPDTLESVYEQYKTTAKQLRTAGYDIPKEIGDGEKYWFKREWTDAKEIYYAPLKYSDWKDGKSFVEDPDRTTEHNLNFVPIEWIKNLPGGDDIDGECTFSEATGAIDDQIEIEYMLSQDGRGLKYSSDPTVLIKKPMFGDGAQVKGAANAIVVQEEGDAKLLEISGKASKAVIEYVKTLREFALEAVRGNRSNAEKISVAQSGRAMEMMNQDLISLADTLKVSYGEGALLNLLKMVVQASNIYKLKIKGREIQPIKKDVQLTLEWPAWYAPTAQDLLTKAQAVNELTDKGNLSRKTAVRSIAPDYDIEDIDTEMSEIETDVEFKKKLSEATKPKTENKPKERENTNA